MVKTVLAAGDKVIATVRNDAAGLKVALGNPADLLVVILDVTKEAEVKQGGSKALEQFGQIDVLLNNAGFGIVGAIEEASNEEVRRQYYTNVFGVPNLVRAVLPGMRGRKSGHIITGW
ncbi:SDR family NAD(P)-dependent oxidoreductase [Mucilaginibacter sp. P25]|uniref:SDR family NAD(P)-dependent oxidoreductase n=1 Tax=unclassified Mucilaginibacter TaxID=2617802 RepID=UPI003D66777B